MSSPAPYPYPPAPVPPRRSNRIVWILVAVVAVSLVACFGISATGFLVLRNHVAAGKTPTAEPSYPNPTGPPVQKHTGALDQYVIVPAAGSHPWPNKPVDEQLPDYRTAAKSFADPATVMPLLTRNVYQRGFVRRWVAADGTIVAVRLFQFGLTEFADDFAQAVKRANTRQGWSAPAAVPGTDNAETQVRPVREAGRVHSIGVLVKDELVVLVDVVQVPPNDPAKLTGLVTQESKALPL